LTGTVDTFSTFACVEPHFNMAKGAHLKFRSHYRTKQPILPPTDCLHMRLHATVVHCQNSHGKWPKSREAS